PEVSLPFSKAASSLELDASLVARWNGPATTMGGAGFEPAKAVPPDLQSCPFGRLGIHPGRTSAHGTGAMLASTDSAKTEAAPSRKQRCRAELAVRVELTTVGLQNRCSAD